ncbi:O-succinylbenzoic acid--CoA ligase [Halopenitus malekzadehii]|uniref:O-succinylbenzoic acid--CoA ligase n=1 Tax=Halopenitus malekzadehii TaxID=1267564 RepID=A0A1H6IDV2_9EURY|nr:class I adenylate-forming enzyme family protein [Halopenitus malekzadehii]SEH47010.1 O-succinylbenzoic acid--CoA ligase [Halopenitus malekzadehii]
MRDWLSHRVVAAPNATALVRAADGEAWTYADLGRLVEETAGRLAAHGVTPGTHLGVHLSPRVGYVGLVHAAMRLGATLVPIGHELTPREIGVRLDRADVDVLVCGAETERTAIEGASGSGIPILSVDTPGGTGNSGDSGDSVAEDSEDSGDAVNSGGSVSSDESSGSVTALHDPDPESVPTPSWEPADRLCVLFTSGTSGRPKAVELTAGNVLFSAIASGFRLGVHPDDRWLVTLPLHHAGGLSPIYRSVLSGTTIVLREDFDPGEAADDIDRYDVTGVSLVPTMLTRMLERRGTLSDSLRTVLLGGAPASEGLIERCENYSIPVYPTYGMTETASQIATATPEEAFANPGTVGRPVFWTDLTVVDDEGEPVDRGETGELVVAGPTVSPGYYGDPDATADAVDEHGLHTGDVGRIDEDGNVHVINRLDDRIVTGGENVDPGDVAGVLADHDAVRAATVLGLPDETWGERVGALLVPADVEDAATDDDHAGDETNPVPGSAGTEPGGVADGAADRDRTNDADGADEDSRVENADTDADAERPTDPVESADDAGMAGERAAGSGGDDPEIDGNAPTDDSDVPAETDTPAETGSERAPPIDERALLKYARERLSGFKMPRTIAYVEEVPRTVSGTVDREAARERLIEEGVDPEIPSGEFDRAGFEPADPEPVDETDSEPVGDGDSEPVGDEDSGSVETDRTDR